MILCVVAQLLHRTLLQFVQVKHLIFLQLISMVVHMIGLANGYSASGQNISGISLFTPGTLYFNLTVTDANGNICVSSTDVTINPNPTVSAGPDVTICLNDSLIHFNGSGANTYTWSGGIQDGPIFCCVKSI